MTTSSFIHSFIHIEHLYSASSRELLRCAPDSSTLKRAVLWGSTTIRLRTFRLRHFVYRHLVYRHFVYYCIPACRAVIHSGGSRILCLGGLMGWVFLFGGA